MTRFEELRVLALGVWCLGDKTDHQSDPWLFQPTCQSILGKDIEPREKPTLRRMCESVCLVG